ncbi:MAG: HAD hydrolase-like protein, partial [Gemmatimonadota bacterium]|nr:HAD hydrolase-like protein [Gemmatimonadota bacterium]
SNDEIDRGFEQLWRRYLTYLEERLPEDPVQVLPGVPQLLAELARFRDIGVGLLTGNIHGGARLKLASGGLWGHFTFGSYGSDHEERDRLPAIAVGRARELFGEMVTAELAVVVGDTPRDVACGKAGGTRTVAVATGAFGVGDLAASDPDYLLEDLTSTGEVVELLFGWA